MRLPFAFLFLVLSIPAFADDAILVTATRNPSKSSDLPFSSGTISGDEWDRYGGQAESALQSVPGLSFSTSGGPGQTRSVFLRGARAEDTLVLVDGIPLNDPLSPSRSFDFSQLPTSGIERIEVLKGPQSVLYGSDAMGGVVQIFTKRNTSSLKVEGGSYDSLKARASHLGLQGGYEKSDGFSSADRADGNTERDGYKSWNLSGIKEFSLSDRASLRVQGLYHDHKTDTDRNGGVGGDSVGTYTRNSQLLFKAETIRISEEGFEWTTAGSIFTRDRDDNTVVPSFYKARLWKAETSVKKNFGAHTPLAGGEYVEEIGRSSEISGRRTFRNGAIFAQEQFAKSRWQAVAGGRMDFHSEQGRATTFRAGLGYWLRPEIVRLKASAGTGFKAPSLYQTYSAYGTPGLRPSRIFGADFGCELKAGDWAGEATYFRNRFRELIDFDSARNRYFNIGKAESAGIELALSRKLAEFSLKSSITTIRSRDLVSGQELLRRPKVAGQLEGSYNRGETFGLSAHLRYVGRRTDIHPSLFSRQAMPSFMTVGMNGYYGIAPGWKITARGENLLDRRYQETSGFGTAGLSGYAGIEAEL